MENNQSVLAYEKKRLENTVALAKKQLEKARTQNEDNKSAIIAAKKELRENTPHSVANLWSSEGFEALAALNQYANPITDKIIDYEEVESQILVLKRMIKSPYFARIDFKFDDEDTPEEIYIGRSSLMKDNAYDIYVYDWRSPIASIFYRFVIGKAFYEAPGGTVTGEINLKRQYEINESELDYFFDADVQIVDEFLRKLLSKNTSPKMKAIVETIQKEQDIVIRDLENDLMMVQGVAGSGKTSIALHRAAYLMYQGLSVKLSANNILIISPNTLFEQYISNVLPELGENNVASVVFEDIMIKILKNKHIQSRNQLLENMISNSQYKAITKSSIEFKSSHQFQKILDRFIEDLPYNWIDFKDVCYDGQSIISAEKIKERILSGGNETTPLGMRLKLIEKYILELIRETMKKRFKKSKEFLVKEELQNFTVLNIENLYRELFSNKNKEYFYSLAKDIQLPNNIEDILAFTQENLSCSYFHYDDAAALTYMHLKINGSRKYKNIKQVVIDEAQDYYPLHFEIFNLLFSNSKFTVLGDINQTLEKSEDITLYEEIQNIFKKKNSTLVTLDKSFRCTNEILNYGSKFLGKSIETKSFNRQGDKPQINTATDQTTLNQKIFSEIEHCRELGYQSIGLICKSEKNAMSLYTFIKNVKIKNGKRDPKDLEAKIDKADLKDVNETIDIQLINHECTADLQGIFIIPVYMSKGLEFDAVLICDADKQNYNNEDDKKLLYIACTRALHRLNLFCKGDASPLI